MHTFRCVCLMFQCVQADVDVFKQNTRHGIYRHQFSGRLHLRTATLAFRLKHFFLCAFLSTIHTTCVMMASCCFQPPIFGETPYHIYCLSDNTCCCSIYGPLIILSPGLSSLPYIDFCLPRYYFQQPISVSFWTEEFLRCGRPVCINTWAAVSSTWATYLQWQQW